MTARRPNALVALSAATIVFLGWTRGAAAPPCFPTDLSWLQADTAGWVVAIATGDSAVAGTWHRPAWWDSMGMRAGPGRIEVYGQWVTIERASDPRDVGSRALFVNWNTDGLCESVPAGRALGLRVGARFFAGGSLRERDARGVAIHDITFFTPWYDAAWFAKSSGGTALTVDEYATFYDAMPARSQWFADPVTFTRRIRAWARANPALSTREPVLGTLASMETDYVIKMDGRRREGAWPHDSLSHPIGLLLRPGMQLLYKGDSDQVWTIDSLAADTTIVGTPHCVRMRLRTGPQSSPARRTFCARAGVLHAYDSASAQLRPTRPLIPDSRLTTRGANGTTSVFVTDSLFVELVAGRGLELVGTTVTTSDSTGRVVRRLREHFAPSLLTAAESTYEVPDSTQAGGWRVVSRFRLAEIRP